MYAFDPERGAERRSRARDTVAGMGRSMRHTGEQWATMLRGRAESMMHRGDPNSGDENSGHRTDFTGFVPHQST